MAIHVALNHITHYKYNRPIKLGPQVIRLRPAPHARTPILSYSLKVTPEEHFINWQQDPQGNYLARLVFPQPTDTFKVEVDLTANMTVINPFDFFLEESAEKFPFKYEPGLLKELKPFLEKYPKEENFEVYCKSINRKKTRTIDFLVQLTQRLNQEIKYLVRMEPGVQAPEETLAKKSGSCRDSAWLLVNILRQHGLAARFVSGYLIQLKADIKALDGPSGTEQDFTDLHAWTEVYLPGAGWVGLDPTSGLLTGEGHIPLVATPEPSAAAPISGALEPCDVDFSHQMTISRFHEDPRVTKPYTEKQWEEILSLGDEVDAKLTQDKVKLTMGGEPTFVSIDDMEGRQWNTEALGKEKRELAEKLMQRMKGRIAQGGLIYSGQGKWYPGEPLPRWVLGCYWRKDGKAIWKDPGLLADETKASDYTTKDAARFIKALAENLDIDPKLTVPGHEDVLYYLWREKRLPANVDPLQSKLKDPLERERFTKLFEKELSDVVGYALPILNRATPQKPEWVSDVWQFRGGYMFLVPGDSPMGLRMPLDSLPWAHAEDLPAFTERDPFDDVGPLDSASESKRSKTAVKKKVSKKKIKTGESAKDVVRIALCVQEREGRIYIFMPPLENIEDYLDLIRHIEVTAADLKMPVVIEGYAPPYDQRVDCFKITPDPGVIEVNVSPVENWKELVSQTNALYDDARECRLGTEKFMLDGRHSGTGGGNHVVLGGATAAESPFLRRPDLLASMIAYWQNHPSLSYLFSGLFIGPTSQAPRVDEGRCDSLYELDIAMKEAERQIEKYGKCPPWMVDRLFRNLLVDGTGNTHRAEICIDKLYSPDSSTGRLGLVEFRGFEMPPHARMSVLQQLLIRALVAMFWNKPYKEKLIRWGTGLHDRFLLPYYVRQDFLEVLGDLNKFGFDFKADYFAPHFEFRFPAIGSVVYEGMQLDLTTAIEPWYVLGEEPAGGGTSRFVDSSVERLQVRLRGRMDKRYQLLCNGYPVPLQRTDINGEYVAGVRYRAWQPYSCLHPTIPVQTPLTFDILDKLSGRSIGGCTYHVVHPGGRNYDTFPVNAFEAEARRNARFFKSGHTPGMIDAVPESIVNGDYPHTLDLRRG